MDNYASRKVLRKIKSIDKNDCRGAGNEVLGAEVWSDWFLRVVLCKKKELYSRDWPGLLWQRLPHLWQVFRFIHKEELDPSPSGRVFLNHLILQQGPLESDSAWLLGLCELRPDENEPGHCLALLKQTRHPCPARAQFAASEGQESSCLDSRLISPFWLQHTMFKHFRKENYSRGHHVSNHLDRSGTTFAFVFLPSF